MDIYAKSLFRGAQYEESNVIQHLSHNSSGVITAKHILRDSDIHFIRRIQQWQSDFFVSKRFSGIARYS